VACIAERRCKTRGGSHVAYATPTSFETRPPHEGRRDSPPVREPERMLTNDRDGDVPQTWAFGGAVRNGRSPSRPVLLSSFCRHESAVGAEVPLAKIPTGIGTRERR
jgi:hypothetical protein